MSASEFDVTFKSFGKSFQEKILQALLSDHSWSQQMMEVIRPEYFEINYLKYLFEIYFKHYTLYKTFPSLTLLATMARDELREGNDELMCAQIVTYLQNLKNNPNVNDLPYVKDRSLNFCKNQALKEALEAAVDLTREQRYEEIVGRIKTAITVGTPNTTGHDFFEDLESRYMKENRSVIATGIQQLDSKEIMNGGLGSGEIGIVMAPTGCGKSHFLVQIGANALRQGLNVLHYTFELSEHKVGIRYDSNFTGVSATDIYEEKEFVQDHYNKNKYGKLIIKDYPTNTATVNTLKAHIEKLAITKSFKPDIIIIDYADIMRSTRQYESLRHELKLIYEELRSLAMELKIPIWSASQTNRESTETDVVGLDKISESFGKAMVCDFIISLSRKPLHKAKGLCNLFIPKNRLGKDGILFPARIDTARSIIEVLDRVIDIEEFEKNANTSQKQLLRDKWNEVAEDRLIELRRVTKKAANGTDNDNDGE
jgi:replicative DNA helicase